MNPFELTKDPIGGGITVRVKHDFVVLTREEEKRVTERITEILAENASLRELVSSMYRNMQGVLDRSTDTVWVDKIATLRDCMDGHMEVMAELGMPPRDYESRVRELETGDHDWCPMQLSGLARCEGPDPVLKAENERLRDYVYALSECKEKACLCEYCPHGRNDFDDDNTFIHCDFDFEQLKQDAGIE